MPNCSMPDLGERNAKRKTRGRVAASTDNHHQDHASFDCTFGLLVEGKLDMASVHQLAQNEWAHIGATTG